MRAELAVRTITALLRGSAIMVVLTDVSVCPGVAAVVAAATVGPAPLSTKRINKGAKSLDSAYFNGIISTSVAVGTSLAAMILAMRCKLSA